MNSYLALFITLMVALIEIRSLDFAAHRGWIGSRLSRKLIHILTGPLFVLCWLLFKPDAPEARWLAALVPLLFTVQFALIGLGIVKDEASVKAMSRSGDRREILKGPLFYGIIFVALTLIYWRDSPIGMVALMLMCGGDGLADLFGRGFRSPKLPWNREKSWAGTAGMFLGGWGLAALIVWIYVLVGAFSGPFTGYLLPITLIALAGTIVESLPIHDVDNLTVTLAAALLGHWLFK